VGGIRRAVGTQGVVEMSRLQPELTGGGDTVQEVQQGHGIGAAGNRHQATAAGRDQAGRIKVLLKTQGKRAHVRPKHGTPFRM